MNSENSKTNQPNKSKILAPTWNDTFDLTNGSYSISDIQDYIKSKIELFPK